ncbi:MAG: hypothetical protein U1F83_13675 [Verrucomicrobiota bacterium]
MSRKFAFEWLLALALPWSDVVGWAGTNTCLPGWSGQLLVPAPTAGLPGWNVEHDVNSSGSLVLATNQSERVIQFNWNIGSGDWVQARYDFAPPLDLSTADILGVTLRGDSNCPPNTVTIMCVDTNDVFHGYDFPGQNSGINQVTRWLPELPVTKKAFCYFWGGSGGSPPLNWSKIRKLFVVVKRPSPGAGGGSGRLWMGRLQYDQAANWPRQTNFVAINTNLVFVQNAAANALQYLRSRQQATGLLGSWFEEPSPMAWLYDQALALIALSRDGVWRNGTPANASTVASANLAQFLVSAQKPDGHWARAWQPVTGVELVDDGWVGDQAWCVMALAEYGFRSGNATARNAAWNGAQRLAGLIDATGAITGFGSTEGTVDVWWAMVATLRFAEAERIKNYLLDPARVWDADLQYWWIGANAPIAAMDCATWLSAFARHPLVAHPECGLAALSFVRRTLLTSSDDGNLCGFDGMGPVGIWNEGTAQFVAAGGEDASVFLDTLLAQQNLDGSLPGSPDNWTTDAFGWLAHWRGLAPTCWLHFAIRGLPFPESTRDTDGDGQPDWAEFVTGNDPQDPTNFFAVDRVEFQSAPGRLQFSWPSRTNRFYTVLSATNLAGAWIPEISFRHVPAAGPRLEFSTTPTGSALKYFRVQCEAE